MKHVLSLVLCFLFIAGLAQAQGGTIGVFGDTGGAACDIYDSTPGLVLVYVVHVYTPGATGCQFKIDDSAASMTFLAESVPAPYMSIGSSHYGIAIVYGMCVPAPNLVLTLQYFAQGLSTACSHIDVVPDPTAVPPGIYVANCAYPAPALLNATGGTVMVNPIEDCMCNVPAEDTTWGQIKSLFK